MNNLITIPTQIQYVADNVFPSHTKITFWNSDSIYMVDNLDNEYYIRATTKNDNIQWILRMSEYKLDDNGYSIREDTTIKTGVLNLPKSHLH